MHGISPFDTHAGINLVYIRDYLGNSGRTSTKAYARTDSEMKRKGIEELIRDRDRRTAIMGI